MVVQNKTLLFYKPDLVMSTFTDEEGRETLKDYIPFEGIYSAGRLDYESEGLLIITDDGELIHRLTDPNQHITKTYFALVEGEKDLDRIRKLEQGLIIQGVKTKPCKAMVINPPELGDRRKKITPHHVTFWLRIEIQEGKKHQIRHMTAAIGYPCLRLIRIGIGQIGIGELTPGQWRPLDINEIKNLKSMRRKQPVV